MVHWSPNITTFHKAQSSKFYFNRAFWDNVISILQQHTRNDVSTLSPGSADYTTSFKPVISSDWILMAFCTGWHNLMRTSHFPDFNLTHWHFLVHWTLTVPPETHLGTEYLWQIVQLLSTVSSPSAVPAGWTCTNSYRCHLCARKIFPERSHVWYCTAKNSHFVCLLWPNILPLIPLYHCLPISSSLQNQSYNDLQLQRILSLSYKSIFPSRRDEKTPSRMNEILNLSRDNALMTKWSVFHQNIWQVQKLTHMRFCY